MTSVDRVQRLKEAKAEAQKEIEALKAQKEREFQTLQKQVFCCGGSLAHKAILLIERRIQSSRKG